MANRYTHKISPSSDSSDDAEHPSRNAQAPLVSAPAVANHNPLLPLGVQPFLPGNGFLVHPLWSFQPWMNQMRAPPLMDQVPGLLPPFDQLASHLLSGIPGNRPTGTYIDHANDDERYSKINCTEETFPIKLYRILSDSSYSEIIAWMPHGRSWKVLDRGGMENVILPKHFNHARFPSFMRQVSGWGFRRFPLSSPDYRSYYHELFLRGLPHLFYQMKRVPGKLKPVLNMDHPDFHDSALFSQLPQALSTDVARLPATRQSGEESTLGKNATMRRGKKRHTCTQDRTSSSDKKLQSRMQHGETHDDSPTSAKKQAADLGLSTTPKDGEINVSNPSGSADINRPLTGDINSSLLMSFGTSHENRLSVDSEIPPVAASSVPVHLGNPYEGLGPQLAPYLDAHDLLEPPKHASQPSLLPAIASSQSNIALPEAHQHPVQHLLSACPAPELPQGLVPIRHSMVIDAPQSQTSSSLLNPHPMQQYAQPIFFQEQFSTTPNQHQRFPLNPPQYYQSLQQVMNPWESSQAQYPRPLSVGVSDEGNITRHTEAVAMRTPQEPHEQEVTNMEGVQNLETNLPLEWNHRESRASSSRESDNESDMQSDSWNQLQ